MPFSPWAARLLQRRSFLRVAGSVAATTGLALAGCHDPTPTTPVVTYSLTGNDNGQLNLAYLLKQVQYAVYKTVVALPPADLQTGDLELLTDLRDQKIVQLLSINSAVATSATVPMLAIDLSTIDLSNRTAVLTNLLQLEDLAVGSFNFNLPFVTTTTTLVFLQKIASAEARHATAVRELLAPDTLAAPDAVLSAGGPLAAIVLPGDVRAVLAPFFAPILLNVDNLPVA